MVHNVLKELQVPPTPEKNASSSHRYPYQVGMSIIAWLKQDPTHDVQGGRFCWPENHRRTMTQRATAANGRNVCSEITRKWDFFFFIFFFLFEVVLQETRAL